jgi:hypothetical protein
MNYTWVILELADGKGFGDFQGDLFRSEMSEFVGYLATKYQEVYRDPAI